MFDETSPKSDSWSFSSFTDREFRESSFSGHWKIWFCNGKLYFYWVRLEQFYFGAIVFWLYYIYVSFVSVKKNPQNFKHFP